MAGWRTHNAHPDIREQLIESHEQTVLSWALRLGDEREAARSRRWITAARAGEPLRVPWWQLPEGTLPRGHHNPNDDVDIGADGTITWVPR